MLSERFDELMKAIGIKNQRQFSLALGISQGYMSEIAAGKKQPTDKILFMISTKFNVRMEWLLEGTGPILKDENLTGLKVQIGNKIDQLPDDQLESVMSFLQFLTKEKK